MDNLSVALKDIPLSRIWNSDERNLSDNPGNKTSNMQKKREICRKILQFQQKRNFCKVWRQCRRPENGPMQT